MINLIPNQEKKKMVRDFYYRLTIVFLGMLCVSLFIAILALLPAYLLSVSKNNIAKEKLEAQKNEPAPPFNQETLAMIKDLNLKLNLIENAEKDKFSVSEKVINAVLLKKIPNVKITRIFYENDLLKGRKISISGTAPSREVLLAFRQALENDTSFKEVDLPISNFVKGSNIEFYLNLIPS